MGAQQTSALSQFFLDLLLNIISKHFEGRFFILLLPFTPLLNYDKCIKVKPPRRWEIFQWTNLYLFLLHLVFWIFGLVFLPINNLKLLYAIVTSFFYIYLMLVFCFTITNIKLGYLQARISHHYSLIGIVFFILLFPLFSSCCWCALSTLVDVKAKNSRSINLNNNQIMWCIVFHSETI